MRELGSFAVLALVSFFFIPRIRAQKEFLREPPSGCGRFRFPPVARLYARRPSSLSPPVGFLCLALKLKRFFATFSPFWIFVPDDKEALSTSCFQCFHLRMWGFRKVHRQCPPFQPYGVDREPSASFCLFAKLAKRIPPVTYRQH